VRRLTTLLRDPSRSILAGQRVVHRYCKPIKIMINLAVITVPPVMRMLTKTQPRASVKSLVFRRVATFGVEAYVHRARLVDRFGETGGGRITSCRAVMFCAVPHIATKKFERLTIETALVRRRRTECTETCRHE